MTTVVNNPVPIQESGGNSMLIGVIALLGFVMVLLYFGLPVIRNMGSAQITIPAPQIVMPEKIDVNVVQQK